MSELPACCLLRGNTVHLWFPLLLLEQVLSGRREKEHTLLWEKVAKGSCTDELPAGHCSE